MVTDARKVYYKSILLIFVTSKKNVAFAVFPYLAKQAINNINRYHHNFFLIFFKLSERKKVSISQLY